MSRDTRRLPQRFPLDSRVDILLPEGSAPRWVPGIVVAHASPGIWVLTAQGRRWFVTNGSRVRETAT